MTNKWKNVLAEVEKVVSPVFYGTWFKSLQLIDIEEDNAILGVPNVFHMKPLVRFTEEIIDAFKKCGIEVKTIKFEVVNTKNIIKQKAREVVRDEAGREINTIKPKRQVEKNFKEFKNKTGLNNEFTMANFVTASNNDLAVQVAESVIENPGKTYNPFFLYGKSGLGKTHLVQAIGNALLQKNPELKILYTPVNHFYADFVNSIRNKSMQEFGKKFEDLDVLIIDDFQLIVNKEKSQEEFFNIFNDLYQLNKQIIVTSDRLPSEIKSVDERLASRLTWAGAIDLQFPNFEDKCAILKSKAEYMGVDIEDEAVEFLAENIKTNIRDLEGEFKKLLAYAELKQMTPLEIIKNGYINTTGSTKVKAMSPKEVIKIVAKCFGISAQELCGKSRVAHIKNARHVAMYILSKDLSMSTNKIAGEVGVKDHTTVLHGIKKIDGDLNSNFTLRDQVSEIREKLYA